MPALPSAPANDVAIQDPLRAPMDVPPSTGVIPISTDNGVMRLPVQGGLPLPSSSVPIMPPCSAQVVSATANEGSKDVPPSVAASQFANGIGADGPPSQRAEIGPSIHLHNSPLCPAHASPAYAAVVPSPTSSSPGLTSLGTGTGSLMQGDVRHQLSNTCVPPVAPAPVAAPTVVGNPMLFSSSAGPPSSGRGPEMSIMTNTGGIVLESCNTLLQPSSSSNGPSAAFANHVSCGGWVFTPTYNMYIYVS